MAIVTVGIDLTKNVFAVHGVDESGKAVLIRPSVKRKKRGPVFHHHIYMCRHDLSIIFRKFAESTFHAKRRCLMSAALDFRAREAIELIVGTLWHGNLHDS